MSPTGTRQARYDAAAAREAADQLRSHFGTRKPVAALILGSGLGGLAERITNGVRVPFAQIPGFPSATVAGHAGVLIAGALAGRRVVALAGRFHMYEGHAAALAAFPTRVFHALGAKTLIVSNAAGGVRAGLAPGDLMLIRDHINFMFHNPLIGPAARIQGHDVQPQRMQLTRALPADATISHDVGGEAPHQRRPQ